MWKKFRVLVIVILVLLVSGGCASAAAPEEGEPEAAHPTVANNLPQITSIQLDRNEVPKYESLEITLELTADYENPYDARQLNLEGTFAGPDGTKMTVPGFWDGKESWKIRFTPSRVGEWHYQLAVTDQHGQGQPAEGAFEVVASDLHGWLQVGSWVDPGYSSQYLAHHDGTPFYGIGHCDALNILIDGFDADRGVLLFDNMLAAGENYVVWWPMYSNSPISNRYDDYTVSNLNLIDLIVADAQEKGVYLIFTIWDHPQLRDQTHSWGDGRWSGYNGFRNLVEIDEFFTSDEAWAWQENFYRYIIARWGYSPAIGLWQTVSEINGTNAYGQTNPWHEKVNAYFVENDPYRHPTTASMSGDVEWPEGHREMDAPQVHVYDLGTDVVGAANTIAEWTELMWQTGKPNWIGEFGVPGNTYYPELFHNSIWAALGSGAALTPAEWNSGGAWMQMSSDMYADMTRLAQFVNEIPLAWLKPSALKIASSDPLVRGWGVAGSDGGLFWVQDYALEGGSIEEVRATQDVRPDVQVDITGLAGGSYTITPYDTWQGTHLEAFDVDCTDGQTCKIDLPAFTADMAFRIERK